MGRWCAAALVALGLLACTVCMPTWARSQGELRSVPIADLPAEAGATLALVRSRGPFPYARDGVVFGNYERRLPARERGYYREYTVPTPGLSHRGARRIVVGRRGELYYTDDHYRTFRRVVE
ncbi:MAG: ribonuclease domain-containing protein [Burkholderiales bacterium]